MKVLIVMNPMLTDYIKSGSANAAIMLAESLRKLGVEVGVICNEVADSMINRNSGITTYHITDISRVGYIKETLEHAVSIACDEGYDIIHVHIHNIAVLEVLRSIDTKGKRIVYTQHTKNINNRFTYRYADVTRDIITSNDSNITVVVPSRSMIDVMKEFTGCNSEDEVRVSVIRNAVRDYLTDYTVDLLDRETDIITCSGIDADKNILSILKFCKKYSVDSVFVAGRREGRVTKSKKQDDYYDMFMEEINNSAGKNISYYDILSNAYLRRAMSRSSVYFSASRSESFGLTVAESLSVGTPVLFVEEPSLCEILDDYTSVMIPRSELRGKRESTRLEIYKKYYDIMMEKIERREITNFEVRNRFTKLGLTYGDYAKNHYDLYESILR